MDIQNQEQLLAKRIRAALRQSGINTTGIAARAGMGVSTLNRKLRGGRGFKWGERLWCWLRSPTGTRPT